MSTRAEQDAKQMSVSELRRALDWQETLQDHACEIGDLHANRSAMEKVAVIKKELRSRGLCV